MSLKSFRQSFVVIFLALIVVLSLMMYPWEKHWTAGYREVFQIELPKGVKCVDEMFITGGKNYSYHYSALLQGNQKALLTLIKLLGMNKMEDRDDEEFHQFVHSKWWVPGSTYGKSASQLYQQVLPGNQIVSNRRYAELVNDKLYFVEFGDDRRNLLMKFTFNPFAHGPKCKN